MTFRLRSISTRHCSYSSSPSPIGSEISAPSRASSSTRSPRWGKEARIESRCPRRHGKNLVSLFQQTLRHRLRFVRTQVDTVPRRDLDRLGRSGQTGFGRHTGRQNHVSVVGELVLAAVETISQHLAEKSLGERTAARVSRADEQKDFAGEAPDHGFRHDSRAND